MSACGEKCESTCADGFKTTEHDSCDDALILWGARAPASGPTPLPDLQLPPEPAQHWASAFDRCRRHARTSDGGVG